MHGLKELPQNCNSGPSQTAGTVEVKLARQFLKIPAQDSNCVGETGKAGIPSDLADRAQNADGAQLFKDVGIAEDGGFDGVGLVAGLVLPNGREYGGDLVLREAHLAEDVRGKGAGVGNVVPAAEVVRILGSVAYKDTEVVQPGGGDNDVPVVGMVRANRPSELDQAGLVTEFIPREGLRFYVMSQSIEGVGRHDTFVICRMPAYCETMQGSRVSTLPGGFGYRFSDILLETMHTNLLDCYCPGVVRQSAAQRSKEAKMLYRA
jgi:hypothetical protein